MAKGPSDSTRPSGRRSHRAGDLLELALGVALVLLLLYIGSFFRLRADLTSEKR